MNHGAEALQVVRADLAEVPAQCRHRQLVGREVAALEERAVEADHVVPAAREHRNQHTGA